MDELSESLDPSVGTCAVHQVKLPVEFVAKTRTLVHNGAARLHTDHTDESPLVGVKPPPSPAGASPFMCFVRFEVIHGLDEWVLIPNEHLFLVVGSPKHRRLLA